MCHEDKSSTCRLIHLQQENASSEAQCISPKRMVLQKRLGCADDHLLGLSLLPCHMVDESLVKCEARRQKVFLLTMTFRAKR